MEAAGRDGSPAPLHQTRQPLPQWEQALVCEIPWRVLALQEKEGPGWGVGGALGVAEGRVQLLSHPSSSEQFVIAQETTALRSRALQQLQGKEGKKPVPIGVSQRWESLRDYDWQRWRPFHERAEHHCTPAKHAEGAEKSPFQGPAFQRLTADRRGAAGHS